MLWPPIRYSYDTINKDYPRREGPGGLCLGYPAPPPWAATQKLCDAPADQLARFNALGNTNWLGLDDQGRDVVARVIYGFRISLLFGLLLTLLARPSASRPAPCRATSAAASTSSSSASSRSGRRFPSSTCS